MNIMIVNAGSPFPLTDGAGLRVVHITRQLAKRHRIFLLLFTAIDLTHDQKDALNELFDRVIVVKMPFKRAFLVSRLVGRRFARVEARSQIRRMKAAGELDVVHYHYPSSAKLTGRVKNIPAVLDLVDSLVLYNERLFDKAPPANVFERLKRKLKKIRVLRQERTMVDSFDVSCVVSGADEQRILEHSPGADTFCIPNGVDTEIFINERKNRQQGGFVIGFVGNMYFPPNIDAMLHFSEVIFPLIRKQNEQVKLYIVGKRPVKEIVALAKNDANIIVTGTVDDVRPFYEKMDVFVAPMRIGGGIKNKVLEAFSMSLPVVSSSLGVEGIPGVIDGETASVANGDQDFVNRVIALLESGDKAALMGDVARQFVTERYSWANTAEQYERIYTGLSNKLSE